MAKKIIEDKSLLLNTDDGHKKNDHKYRTFLLYMYAAFIFLLKSNNANSYTICEIKLPVYFIRPNYPLNSKWRKMYVCKDLDEASTEKITPDVRMY